MNPIDTDPTTTHSTTNHQEHAMNTTTSTTTASTRTSFAKRLIVGTTALAVLAAGTIGALATGGSDAAATSTSFATVQPRTAAKAASTVRPADVGASLEDVARTVATDRVLHKPGQRTNGDTGQWASMADFVSFVVNDAANVWSWYYRQWTPAIQRAITSQVNYRLVLPGQRFESGCSGGPAIDTSFFYCSASDTIFVGYTRAASMWNKGGDYAVAYAVAHEYGHNVEAELNVSRARIGGPKHEQLADCLSGAFTHVAYYQGILDRDDVQQGVNMAWLVGDDGTGSDPHGSPQQRVNAFWTGWANNSPAACWTALGI